MQNTQKSMKTMSEHGFRGKLTQFELTTKLLQNLNKFKLTPTAKLVLMYLSSCYNPKHGEMFPKQRTIADKLGVSEASIIRAVSELHKEGLIISERKYTNRYVFTSKFLSSLGISDDNMQGENSQNESRETCKMIPAYIEQIKETNKPTKRSVQKSDIDLVENVEDFKILKEYAIRHNGKNIPAYINYLKSKGIDKQIITEYKQAQRKAQRMKDAIKQNIKDLEFAREHRAVVDKNYFANIRNQLK